MKKILLMLCCLNLIFSFCAFAETTEDIVEQPTMPQMQHGPSGDRGGMVDEMIPDKNSRPPEMPQLPSNEVDNQEQIIDRNNQDNAFQNQMRPWDKQQNKNMEIQNSSIENKTDIIEEKSFLEKNFTIITSGIILLIGFIFILMYNK